MWRKKDSDNLESIAKSLEKLVERERERQLLENSKGVFSAIKERVVNKVKVTDGLNPNLVEDEAIEETLKIGQRMNSKLLEADKANNLPFCLEDLFDEEELETL